MSIKSIPLADSTPAQRLAYVRDFLNLPLDTADDDVVRAKIEQAQPNMANIFVQEADGQDAPEHAVTEAAIPLKPEEGAGRQSGTLGKGDPRAVIFIPPVETEDGQIFTDVVVGVNGRAWQLVRGQDLNVPWRVVCALQDAVQDNVRHLSNEGHEGEVSITSSKRINFNFIDKPSQAEIDEWLERTGKQFCA